MGIETSKPGLRERKKNDCRSALSRAAVRLTVERGFQNVLVEDIASAVGVSPRTFNNYFSSKAEAIAARHVDRLRAMAADLRKRDKKQPLWEAISAAVITQFCAEPEQEAPPSEHWAMGVRTMIEEPSVQAELLRGSRAAEKEIAAVIAKRIGSDANSLYPQLAAAATGVAVQISLERCLSADPPLQITQILRRSLKQIATLSEYPNKVRVGTQLQKRSK